MFRSRPVFQARLFKDHPRQEGPEKPPEMEFQMPRRARTTSRDRGARAGVLEHEALPIFRIQLQGWHALLAEPLVSDDESDEGILTWGEAPLFGRPL